MDYKEACDILEEIADYISKSDLSFKTKIKYSTALDFGIYGAERRIPESPIHTDDTYCGHCFTKLEDYYIFCPCCGQKINRYDTIS